MTDRPTGDAEGTRVPRRRRRKPRRWNKQRRTRFLEKLAQTCNVSAAARAARMDRSSAYDLKDRDPAFARSWGKALEQAHGGLELWLLEIVQKGSVKTYMTLDPKTRKPTQIKVEHEFPLTIGLRLYLSHRAEAAAFREMEMADRNDGEVSARAIERMTEIRAKLLTAEAEEIWGRSAGEAGDDERAA